MTWAEYHACKYTEGQTPASVADFADSWNAWVDSEDREDYSAAILNPLYRSPPTAVDMLRLGASSSNKSMAAGQSEIKEMERTLNYIYWVVQANEKKIQATQEDVWAVSDLIVAVYEEEQGEQ